MSVLNPHTDNRPGKSPALLQYTYNGRKRLFTALMSICVICLMAFSHESNVTPPAQIDAEDMVQNGIYYFADHGNGMSVAKYDRMEGDNIYTFNSIKPLLLSYSGAGLWGTVSDAGAIRVATPMEIIHLLLCIVAGVYVSL